MDSLETRVNEIERRVDKLENQREKDKDQLYQLDASLKTFVTEMKHISDDLKTVVTNFKEAIMRSTNAQEKELKTLKQKEIELENKLEKLDVKIQNETVGSDAKKWRNIISHVLSTVIGAIVTFVLVKIGMGV